MKATVVHIKTLRLGMFLLLLVVFIILVRQLVTSAFFTAGDRIHILFYSSTPTYFSLEKEGGLHYVTSFGADSRTEIPGGYDIYRIGALQKLASIEHNPSLFKRVFSRVTGSMLDFYFYPGNDTVYYGTRQTVALPSFSQIFFQASNANFFDRLYIWLRFVGKNEHVFDEIAIHTIVDKNEILLSDKAFGERYIGYFYYKSLRQENKTVQILYTRSYNAALNVSRIIDGTGIRVVDIDSVEIPPQKNTGCKVTEDTAGSFSHSAQKIATFFSCELVRGKGKLSGIVLYLNAAEKEWE